MRRIAVALSVLLGLGWGGFIPPGPAEAQRVKVGLEFINSRASVLVMPRDQGLLARPLPW